MNYKKYLGKNCFNMKYGERNTKSTSSQRKMWIFLVLLGISK